MRKPITYFTFCLLLLASLGVLAQTPSAESGRPETDLARDALDHPQQVLDFAGVQPGMVIADIFAGSGYYAEQIANSVGADGRVYLHNNAAYLGFVSRELDQRLANERLPAVTRIDREADALDFEADSLDGVFMVLVLHDFWFREKNWQVSAEQLLPQLRAALKPGGFLLVMDHVARPGSGSADAQTLHRVEESTARATLESFGFEFVNSSPLLRNPADDHTTQVFDKVIKGKTDRFLLLYRSPD